MLTNLHENMLSELGYDVIATTDSREAVRIFADNASSIELVITDQTMPYLTGEELIQKLHKIRPDLPTVLCTGNMDRVSQSFIQDSGANAFCLKPVTLAKLGKVIRSLLDNRQPSA